MKVLTFDKTSGAFTKAKIFHYYELPVKITTNQAQAPFIKMVDEIMEMKKQGKATADFEKELDFMVYQLYELTAEEIAIVEGKNEFKKTPATDR